jgi:hypothetical protein
LPQSWIQAENGEFETHTMYPEYRKKIKDSYVRLEPCKSDCGAMPKSLTRLEIAFAPASMSTSGAGWRR